MGFFVFKFFQNSLRHVKYFMISTIWETKTNDNKDFYWPFFFIQKFTKKKISFLWQWNLNSLWMDFKHCPTHLWEEILNFIVNKWLLNKINYCTKKGLVIYLFYEDGTTYILLYYIVRCTWSTLLHRHFYDKFVFLRSNIIHERNLILFLFFTSSVQMWHIL